MGWLTCNKRKSLALKMPEMSLEDLGEKLEISMQDKWNNVTAAHRKMEIAQRRSRGKHRKSPAQPIVL